MRTETVTMLLALAGACAAPRSLGIAALAPGGKSVLMRAAAPTV